MAHRVTLQDGAANEVGTADNPLAITIADFDLTDPLLNDVIKWNGEAWVPGDPNNPDEFTFSISSFVDNQTNTQLIGAGVWVSSGGITFTISYLNGPPASATIAIGGSAGVSWSSPITLVDPFTSASSEQDTDYPSNKDTTITFTLTADGETDTESVLFTNYIKWGVSSVASGYTSADVTSLSGSYLGSAHTRSEAISASTGEYIIYAFPSSYTSINSTGFLFNSVTCPFQSAETVSVTNSAGFTENYKVYRSTSTALGSSTLTTSTSSNLINKIYWGVSSVASGYTESDIEGLSGSAVSNDNTRTFTVDAAAGEYILYAYPSRLGTVVFFVGGFEGGFQSPATVSVTNVNGYTENYYIYRSTNSGLGDTEVTTE